MSLSTLLDIPRRPANTVIYFLWFLWLVSSRIWTSSYMFIIELEAGCSKNSHNMVEAMLTTKKQHEIIHKGFFPL